MQKATKYSDCWSGLYLTRSKLRVILWSIGLRTVRSLRQSRMVRGVVEGQRDKGQTKTDWLDLTYQTNCKAAWIYNCETLLVFMLFLLQTGKCLLASVFWCGVVWCVVLCCAVVWCAMVCAEAMNIHKCVLRLLCSVYCLCVNVCCTAATGCQPNCS
jgi:hypothetical protein